jgi:hypothetical protein
VLELAQNKSIFVPEYLLGYVSRKLPIWTESAFQVRVRFDGLLAEWDWSSVCQAKGMEANDEFVIDTPSSASDPDKKKRIIVLDKDVGVEQYSSRWSNGLAQFLELKYRRKISVESLKAVFMSNKKFFQLYGSRLFGLTGTLGEDVSRRFLLFLTASFPAKP